MHYAHKDISSDDGLHKWIFGFRYDRSLWPEGGAASANGDSMSSQNAQFNTQMSAVSKDNIKTLRQRMATVLDVELCAAA